MTEKLNIDTLHWNIYFILILSLAISLPLSIFLTSLVEILLMINWLAEGKFRRKLQLVRGKKSIIIFCSLYVLFIGGLIYTTDFSYAFQNLKLKLPLLVLPLIIGTSKPFSDKEMNIIFLSFTGGTLISTLVSSALFFTIIPFEYTDVREISVFISHIRLSLMVVFSFFILIHFIVTGENHTFLFFPWKLVFVIVCIWFPVFLFILKSLTGLLIFGIAFLVVAWYYAGKIGNVAPVFIIRVLVITLPLVFFSYITRSIERFYYREPVDFSSLDKYSHRGNEYYHDTLSDDAENGHLVWLYISEDELREGWNRISSFDYDGKDKRGQDLKFTLIRYLSSKGLRKDQAGIDQLTKDDIVLVEKGLTNYLFQNRFSLYPRIYEVIWEIDRFRKSKEPGDHSVSQRLLYNKAAIYIFLKYPLFGTGTGDIKNELHQYYREYYPGMPVKLRKYPHNQYLTILMTLGIIGFSLFFCSIFLPVIMERRWKDFIVRIFFLILFLSMLGDDTLETQTGVSFFAFFYSVLILGAGCLQGITNEVHEIQQIE